jgi:hypothetical protein
MDKIQCNILIIKSYRVYFSYEYSNGINFVHSILLEFQPDDALVKIAMLSRPYVADIYFIRGAVARKSTVNFLRTSLVAEIDCEEIPDLEFSATRLDRLPQKLILMFSGGFDSIAAYFLLKDRVELVSIDFGGDFEREKSSFSQFNTKLIDWDIRRVKDSGENFFKENLDWRFMLSPAFTYQESSPIAIISGTNLESSPWQFMPGLRENFNGYDPYTFGPGIANFEVVSPLSEFCTAMIVLKCMGEDAVNTSLLSLADSYSIKLHRKKLLLAAVKNIFPPEISPLTKKYKYGASHVDDILTLYFIWKFGLVYVLKNFCDNIPLDYDTSLNMSYFERYNTNNLKIFDKDTADYLIKKYEEFDIVAYGPTDLYSLAETVKIRNQIINSHH